jgi:hypothetical protein
LLHQIENDFMVDLEKVTDTFLITKKFRSPSEFSYFIEGTARRTKTSCIDILINFCLENEIESESIAKLINPSLKEKLESEAQELNLLKTKSTKLPF